MCIHRFGKPYPVFKPECFISQCSNRANINHVATEIIVNRFGNISGYFSMITPVQYTMYPVIRLTDQLHTYSDNKECTLSCAIVYTDRYLLFQMFFLKIRNGYLLCHAHNQDPANDIHRPGRRSGNPADDLINKKFYHTGPCIFYSFTGNIFYYHSIHHRCTATGYQFWHWPWISC